MVKRQIVFTKLAQKDALKLSSAGLKNKTEKILEILQTSSFKNILLLKN